MTDFSAPPVFESDAIVLGILIVTLAVIFKTSSSKQPFFQKFYKYVPALLLCYFVPAIFNTLGIISPSWIELENVIQHLASVGYDMSNVSTVLELKKFIDVQNVPLAEIEPFIHSSELYYVASRFLLPASLVLLCLSIDLKGVVNLGPKALIMFFTATIGIVIGGPLALWTVSRFAPELLQGDHPDSIWRGLSTVAGSWIGGGANQTAMKEIAETTDTQFSAMIVVDVVVANLWMAFLLIGAGVSDKLDRILKADNSAITALKKKVEDYQSNISRIASLPDLAMIAAVAFGAVAAAHFGADLISPAVGDFIEGKIAAAKAAGESTIWMYVTSISSGFFWLVVLATTIGVIFSFTRFRKLEGAGASKVGSLFLYILVASIGMKMDILQLFREWEIFKFILAIGLLWMLFHVVLLLIMAFLIRAPFFFVAVGSQANVGGAASAPIVASAFSPALAPVGVLLAVFGYAVGTFAAIICMELMRYISL
jgi:uncharacterized membrane protein